MKIYTLIEDDKRKGSGYLAESGISLYFEYGGKRILFNTGASDAFVFNATLLGIDINKIDICIISDAYNDQIGGLKSFFSINNHAKVYLKSAVRSSYYIKRGSKKEPAGGVSQDFADKYAGRLVFFDYRIDIIDGITAASVKKFRRFPFYTSVLYEERNEGFINDGLEHELYVAIRDADGVAVLTGCAHHGVINMLMSAHEDFGEVKAVAGGFRISGIDKKNHLKEPDFEIAAIAKYLENHNIKKVYTGHGVGAKAMEKLGIMSRAQKIYAGDIFEI